MTTTFEFRRGRAMILSATRAALGTNVSRAAGDLSPVAPVATDPPSGGVPERPIGAALQDERIRRGLSLADCEAQLHIRAKFLAAIEEDRDDDLPEPTYARIFLRGYANFLAADADALVRELDRRTGETISRDHVIVTEQAPEAGRSIGIGRRVAEWGPVPQYRAVRIAVVVALAVAVLAWLGYRAELRSGPATVAPPSLGTENIAPPTTPTVEGRATAAKAVPGGPPTRMRSPARR